MAVEKDRNMAEIKSIDAYAVDRDESDLSDDEGDCSDDEGDCSDDESDCSDEEYKESDGEVYYFEFNLPMGKMCIKHIHSVDDKEIRDNLPILRVLHDIIEDQIPKDRALALVSSHANELMDLKKIHKEKLDEKDRKYRKSIGDIIFENLWESDGKEEKYKKKLKSMKYKHREEKEKHKKELEEEKEKNKSLLLRIRKLEKKCARGGRKKYVKKSRSLQG
jgi:hypothetical protein